MERINYQHLYYFWMVAREESVTRAAEKLHLAQPTISGQLAALEDGIGAKLFVRERRRLALTDTGRLVFRYAEEIFSLGRELAHALKGRPAGRGLRLHVGIADVLPKLVAYRLMEPALHLPEPVQLICHEDKAEKLFAEIGGHRLDLLLSDVPATPASGAGNLFNHLLGESPVSVFAEAALAERYRRDFPRCLSGAPFLLSTGNTALRRSLDQWFDEQNIAPQIKAEISDSALLKTFGSAGVGLFVAPSMVEREIQRQYQVQAIGRIEAVQERFYAVTSRTKLEHPAVTAIVANVQGG